MSSSQVPDPEKKSGGEAMTEFWLPQDLYDQLLVMAKEIKVSPLVFIKKAIGVHQLLRSEEPVAGMTRAYDDLDELRKAFGMLRGNDGHMMMYHLDLEGYLKKYEEADSMRSQGQDPRDVGFGKAEVMLSAEANAYVDSRVYFMPEADYYLSAQAFGIAATLELVYLYMEILPPPSDKPQ